MSDVSGLLSNAIAQADLGAPDVAPIPVPQAKAAEVQAATDAKKAEMGGSPSPAAFQEAAAIHRTGAGLATSSGDAHELATMSADQLRAKYGDEAATHMIFSLGQAANKLDNLHSTDRSWTDVAKDSAIGAGLGVVNSVGGVGALGAGLVNNKAGTAIAKGLSDLNDYAQTLESHGLQNHRELASVENALGFRDNTAQYEKDKETDGAFVAGLKHIGRDILTSGAKTLSDPTLLSDVAAQGLGSIATAGPMAKGLGALSKAVLPAAARTGLVSRVLPGAMPVTVGLQEAGGAYQQTASDMLDEGKSPDEAGNAALTAAAIAAPGGMLAGKIADKFLEHPFAVKSLGHAGSNLLKETGEEALQGASGQMAQNVAEGKDITEGVGDQVAQGALGGLTGAGITQAPGTLKHAAGAVAKGVANKIASKFQENQDTREKASPVSTENVALAGAQAAQVAKAPETQTALQDAVEKSPAIKPLADKIIEYGNFDPAEFTSNPNLSPEVKEAVSKAPDRANAALSLAREVNAKGVDHPQGLAAAAELHKQVSGIGELANSDPQAFEAIDEAHPANAVVEQFNTLVSKISNTPAVAKAFERIQALKPEEIEKLLKPVTEDNLQTPEGQQNVQNALMLAAQAPEKVPLPVVSQIQQMAEKGKLSLSPDQHAALKTSSAILQAVRDAQEAHAAQGLKTPLADVNANVLTEKSKNANNQHSAAYYAKNIYNGIRSGNLDYAQEHMNMLGQFVQHMQNKVAALNTHFQQGVGSPGVSFQAWNPKLKTFYKGDAQTVHNKAGSIDYAKTVGFEASRLTDIYNNLSKAFPQLKAGTFDQTPIDRNLAITDPNDLSILKRPALPQDRSSLVQQAKPVQSFRASEKAQEAPVREEAPVEPKKAESQQEAKPVEAESQAEATPEAKTPSASEGSAEKGAEAQEPKSLKEAFPNLVHAEDGAKGKNWFHEAYKIAKGKSLLFGESKPVQKLLKAIRSNDAFEEHTGDKRETPITPEVAQAYRESLKAWVPALRGTLEKRLQERLNDEPAKSGKNEGKNSTDLLNSGFLNNTAEGKALNLVERQKDGSFKYNDALAHGALLAGIQWLLTYNDNAPEKTGKYVSSLTGIPEEQAKNFTDQFEGLSDVEAVRSLAQKILDYWGVKKNDDAYKSFTDGIAHAMAVEVLQALSETELGNNEPFLTQTKIRFTHEDGVPIPKGKKEAFRDVIRLVRNLNVWGADGEMDPLFKDPRLIDEAVLTEPPVKDYYGDSKMPAPAKTQLHNPGVELTKPQRAMIQRAQNFQHFVNERMHSLYGALGRDALLDLFGGGSNVDERKKTGTINLEDYKSLKGQNQTVDSAWEYLSGRIERMSKMEGKLSEIPIHFTFGVATNGRLMMLGAQNPQASKLVREVILPTWSTVDLSKPENLDLFKVAIGQALGLKIHKMTTEAITSKVDSLLKENFAQSLKLLGDHLNEGELHPDFAQQLQRDFAGAKGTKLTPAALHALQEYARFSGSSEKTAFKTGLYLEADGVTNGVVNALHMFTGGRFTGDQIANLMKGGWLPTGEGQPNTMNELRTQRDDVDLYAKGASKLKDIANTLFKSYPENHPVRKQMNNLFNVMENLFGGDLTFDSTTGELSVDRGITKNPMTITFYGSGPKGIAGNLAGEIMTHLYEKMSEVAAHSGNDIAKLFDGDREKTEKFLESFHDLLANVTTGKAGELELYSSGQAGLPPDSSKIDPVKFKLEQKQFDTLQQNVLKLLVGPMVQGIKEALGSSVMDSKDILQRATQAQSVALQALFAQKVDALRKENRGFFPSENQLKGALKELQAISPVIDTGDQRFFPVKTGSADFEMNLGRGLHGELRTPAEFHGPVDVGVGGLAMLNQGMGDGRMAQIMINNGVQGLPVFDGYNLALDKAKDGSQKANSAVNDTWSGNPLEGLHESYSTFMEHVNSGLLDDPKVADAMLKVLFRDEAPKKNVNDLKKLLGLIQEQLAQTSKDVDARHSVMREYAYKVDHMAGAQAPHENPGKALPRTPEEIASTLNSRLDEKAGTKKEEPKGEAKDISVEFDHIGMVVADAGLLPQQEGLFRRIVNTGALDGYRFVIGSLKQIEDYRGKLGLSLPDDLSKNTKGFIDHGAKIIHLISPTGETVLHEAIHAATFAQILAHYEGAKLELVVHETVKRLEELMDQFRGLDLNDKPDSFIHALANVNAALDEGTALGRANALNEFMAWTLANKEIASVTKKVPVLVQMAQNVWQAIKKLVFKGYAPRVGNDLYSNLVFHTSVLVESRASVGAVDREVMQFQNAHYGTDDRLTELNTKLDSMFSRFLNPEDAKAKVAAQREASPGVTNSAKLSALANAQGFNMTPQAQRTFRRTVQLLSLSMKLNPASLAAMEELYRHAAKNLTPDMLLDKSQATNQAAMSIAEGKVDMLLNPSLVKFDAQGRSSLLPVFMGLALVDDDLRNALKQMDLPKSAKDASGTLDAFFDNATQKGFDALARKFSGVKHAQNVKDAIDTMTNFVADDALTDKTVLDTMANAPTNATNWANDTLTQFIGDASKSVIDKSNDVIKDPSKSAFTKKVAEVTKFMAHLATEEKADVLAEGALSALNKWNDKHTLREVIGDVIGRTRATAPVFDMIKQVRTLIQQTRQQFRDKTPSILAKQFSQKLSDEQQSHLFHGMAKTDIASFMESHSIEDVLKLVSDPSERAKEKSKLEAFLQSQDLAHWPKVQAKSQQLAKYMITGEHGTNLLRNAQAVSRLLLEKTSQNRKVPAADYVKSVDKLITLYAIDNLSPEVHQTLSSLVQGEAKGMAFVLSYLNGQRKDEIAKSNGVAHYNAEKGYIPSIPQDGVSLIVRDDKEAPDLLAQSYVRVADYKGSRLEQGKGSKGYWMSPASAKTSFQQGILQTVNPTAGGVDKSTGFSEALRAGRITNPGKVRQIAKYLAQEGATRENLVPVFNEQGEVIAFERAVDPTHLKALNQDTNLAKMLGAWRGRQVEENLAQTYNETLVDRLKEVHAKDIASSALNQKNYVDLLDPKSYGEDKVILDAVKLITPETKAYIKQVFGNNLYVRRDLVNDVIGYHQASITDAWTGNSRWKPETQEAVKKLAIAFMGNDAFKTLITWERNLQGVIADTKNMIVVKSMIVPAMNAYSNMYQLLGRGVSIPFMVKAWPRLLSEANTYTEGRIQKIQAEADLRAAEGNHDRPEQIRLKAKIQSLDDGFRRLSIWPMIEAGEFGAISSQGVSSEDLMLTGGKLEKFIVGLVNKMPKDLQNVGRYGLVTRDTPLYRGLQKSVEYGDFLAKALYYEHLMKNKKMDATEALGKASEEFVHFDRLPGRSRGYLDSIGLLWFFNHKLRSAKIAMSMIRDNPVQALMMGGMGHMLPFEPESPIHANIFSKMLDGRIWYAVGPKMAAQGPLLNPWLNMIY